MSSATNSHPDFLLSEALAGSRESFGQLLGVYRNYLKLLVISQLERRLQSRVSASDVVQETFLEADRDFHQFRGTSVGEFCAWMRKILAHNLQRVVEQHVLTAKRSVRREVSLELLAGSLDRSSARLDSLIPDGGTSPSMRIERHEQELALANAIAELPADYRDVIILRHLEGLSFETIAVRMERTAGAVRMLWLRAIRSLKGITNPTHADSEASN